MTVAPVDRMAQNERKLQFLKYASVAIFSSLLTFSVALVVFAGSTTVELSLVQPEEGSPTATPTPTLLANTANPTTSGQVALTESELVAAVKTVGGPIYWLGSAAGAKYTFNNVADGQNFIRYLPGGNGLADTEQKYLIVATYKDARAYETIQKAAKSENGVTLTNPDGSIVYYAKASPLHVYLVFKNLAYQIEIFDPTPGAAFKLATTSGILKPIL